MATKKPSSTISFNSDLFLSDLLPRLVRDGYIFFYAYIRHEPEEDTKKLHYHLFVSPSRPLDMVNFRKEFIEPVNGEKPLGCLPFQSSKISDWILYALHDINYLNKKGLFRLNHYMLEDFITNDDDFLLQSFSDAKETFTDNRMALFLSLIEKGSSFGEILRSGIVPPNQIVYWEKVYASSFKSHFGKKLDENGNIKLDVPFMPDI